MMDITVPLPTLNKKRPSWSVTAFLIRVSIMSSITLQRISKRPIPQISSSPLGVMINVLHPISSEIFPCYHMNYTSSISFIHFSGLGGGGGGYLLHQVSLPKPHPEVFIP